MENSKIKELALFQKDKFKNKDIELFKIINKTFLKHYDSGFFNKEDLKAIIKEDISVFLKTNNFKLMDEYTNLYMDLSNTNKYQDNIKKIELAYEYYLEVD